MFTFNMVQSLTSMHKSSGSTTQLLFLYGILFMLQGTCSQSSKTPVGQTEFCESEFFTAKCNENEVVVMDTAKYGRMRINKCVKENFGYIGCGRDVLEEMDAFCSGRRECSVKVLDEVFDSIKRCHEDLKSYLYALYNCVAVAHPGKSSCRNFKEVALSGSTGYMSSIVSEESGCGSTETPWVIQVQHGQRISIYLYDFSLKTNVTTVTPQDYVKVCRVYATLRDVGNPRSVTVCGGRERVQHVYSSTTNRVEMRILNSKTPHKPNYFMFKYEAVGCPTLKAPAEGWLRMQDPSMAIMGCNDKQESWRLQCNGTEWDGVIGNCSRSIADTVTGPQDLSMSSLSFEISVMVVILLAITIGLLVLALGLFCMRKHAGSMRRRPQGRPGDESSGDESARELAPKTILTPHSALHPTTIISCPRDCAFRENEYASMRLLHPDHVCDHENILNHTRDPRRIDTYGNPQEPKNFETFSSTTDNGMTSDYPPQFLDIDPDAFHMQIREVHIASTLPRGAKHSCVPPGSASQTKTPPGGKDSKFSIVDSFGTARKPGGQQRSSYPGDPTQCPSTKCVT